MGMRTWLSALVSGAGVVSPVKEAVKEAVTLPEYDFSDPDINLSATGGGSAYFRRLTQSPADLSALTQERMQQLGLHLYDRNPLGRAIVDLIAAFVIGDGLTVQSKDDEVQAAIDRFWDDDSNHWEQRAEDYCRELSIYGEQCPLAFVNPTSGRVAIVSTDPRTIKGVVPHPERPDRPLAVCFQGKLAGEERYVNIIHEDDDPASPTFGKLIGAQPGDMVPTADGSKPYYAPPSQDGSVLAGCFLEGVNKTSSALRGRSDLLPVADFVDLYDRLVFDEAERMSFLRAFVYVVTVQGAQAETLAARAKAEPPPKPGTVKFANENEKWEAVSPSLGSQDSQNVADLILSLIASGVGLPKVWLNGLMDVNRASASEMSEPAIKRLTTRQKRVVRALTRIVRFALDQAELAGVLAPAGDGRHEFHVNAPEMSSKDLEKVARSFQVAMQAAGMAEAADWLDDETALRLVVTFLGLMGQDVDLDEIRERVEAQREKEAEDEELIPGYFGVGANPGTEPLAQGQKADAVTRGAIVVPRRNGRTPTPTR